MRYSVINVYAPCQGQDRQAFASHLQAILPTDGRTVLMGGEFNCFDTQYDAIPLPKPEVEALRKGHRLCNHYHFGHPH